MAVYRSSREYFFFVLLIFFGLYTIYRGYDSQLEVQNLRKELQKIQENVHHDTHDHINEVVESHQQTGVQLQMLQELMSKITSKTNEFAAKFPELEKKLWGIQQEHEGEEHEVLDHLHEKIGVLEGVVNELHAQQEEHEEEHAEIEAKLKPQAQSSANDLADLPIQPKFDEKLTTVLLIIASSQRPDYLQKTLHYVTTYHPKDSISVLVSEDGESPEVHNVVSNAFEEMKANGITVPLLHLHHPAANQPAENGYFRLSRHFKWALTQIFSTPIQVGVPIAKRVIILEEDLQIAPDFFEYFTAIAPLLDSDDTLLAASAWNDNGIKGMVKDKEALYRSDFFPGLGWMMPKRIWDELQPKWPKAYWDDWLREPQHRKGRHTIRPEICRTFHFGKKGVSNGQYSKFLDEIVLNSEFVPFTKMNLNYLKNTAWDRDYISRVLDAPIIRPSLSEIRLARQKNLEIRLQYDSLEKGKTSFVTLANLVGAMDNIKANVPRTAYRGVVSIWFEDMKIHITPIDLAK